MDAQERRLRVLDILKEGERVRGTELAKALGVSRQIIVGDVALLKAGGRACHFHAPGVLHEEGAPGISSHPGVFPQTPADCRGAEAHYFPGRHGA